jgi:hypothetical protein
MGEPMEPVLRQCLIALKMAEKIGLGAGDLEAVYFAPLVACVGCREVSTEFFHRVWVFLFWGLSPPLGPPFAGWPPIPSPAPAPTPCLRVARVARVCPGPGLARRFGAGWSSRGRGFLEAFP